MSRKSSNSGRRVRIGPISNYGAAYNALEGVLVEKTNDSAWPFRIMLDKGEEVRLDDWQFEFIGPATATLQPVRASKPEPVKREVEIKQMAKTATKTTRERVRPKTEGKSTDSLNRVARKVVAKAGRSSARVAPTKGKATARTTTKEAPAKTATKKHWPEVVLGLMGGKRIVLSGEDGFYEKHEGALAKMFGSNSNIKATIRQTLQGLARANKVKNVRPGVWEVLGGSKAKPA